MSPQRPVVAHAASPGDSLDWVARVRAQHGLGEALGFEGPGALGSPVEQLVAEQAREQVLPLSMADALRGEDS